LGSKTGDFLVEPNQEGILGNRLRFYMLWVLEQFQGQQCGQDY
jgi:hypothetical protein